MQPGIALRDGLGGGGDAGTDEFQGHATDKALDLGVRILEGYSGVGVEGRLRFRESRWCRIILPR